MEDTIDYIESLIAKGNTERALELLLDLTSKNKSNAKKSVILTSSQFNRVNKNQLKGAYQSSEVESHYLKIDSKILDYLDLIKEEYQKQESEQENFDYLNVNIEIPELLRTPLQQYLIFFTDFVKVAKGVNIVFEVLQNELGLEIAINNKLKIPLSIIQEWLNEYIGFTKVGKEEIIVKVETENLAEENYENLILELKNQVKYLNDSLDLIKRRRNSLQNENKNLKKIVDTQNILKIGSNNSIISPFEKAKDLIGSGKTSKALEILISLSSKDDDIQNELRLHFSRINILNLDYRLGQIDDSFRYKEMNKINKAVLDFVRIVEKKNQD